MASKNEVTFSNGKIIPIIGLGTWQSGPGEVTKAVMEAISCGYRHIDCASAYGNETEIGKAIAAKVADGTVKREELFITSKLWLTSFKREMVVPALQKTLTDLGLSNIDLYLIHWPVGLKAGKEIFPQDANGKTLFSDIGYMEAWMGMEDCYKKGLAKSIGVSNFNRRQLQKVLDSAEIPPVNNQVECHPYLSQKKLTKFCNDNNITVTAYSPLASPERPEKSNEPELLEDPKVKELAEKYGKTPGQILIKYQIQNGIPVIPKSVTKSRIESNIQVFEFVLSSSDMKSLENLNENRRYVRFSLISEHPEYPFNDEY